MLCNLWMKCTFSECLEWTSGCLENRNTKSLWISTQEDDICSCQTYRMDGRLTKLFKTSVHFNFLLTVTQVDNSLTPVGNKLCLLSANNPRETILTFWSPPIVLPQHFTTVVCGFHPGAEYESTISKWFQGYQTNDDFYLFCFYVYLSDICSRYFLSFTNFEKF